MIQSYPVVIPSATGIGASGGGKAVISTMRDPEAKPGERFDAAKYIVDKVLGKAAQPIQIDAPEEIPTMTLDEMLELCRDVVASVDGK